ncbi:MAG: hypothetical protein KDA96_09040, partial [Planctomycetaceae bacterium]|nr:hypothetical protein [Planctomycetaceae bacterium]
MRHGRSRRFRSERTTAAWIQQFHATEKLEERLLLTDVPFQERLLFTSTDLPQADDRFTMQSTLWDGDAYTDLLLIQRAGTSSSQVEVAVYSSAASRFDNRSSGGSTAYTQLFPTALPEVNEDWVFRVDFWGGGTKPDLFAIHKAGTTSGFVEVQIFTGESGFTTGTSVFQTPLAVTGADWDFDLGHYNLDSSPDLFAIRRNGQFTSELTILSGTGSSAFSSPLLQTRTAIPPTSGNEDFVVGDLENDGIADLWVIRNHGTESGFLEFTVLSGAVSPGGDAPFQWIQSQATTPLTDTWRDWGFDQTPFHSPFTLSDDGTPDLVAFQRIESGAPEVHLLSGAVSRPSGFVREMPVPATALFTDASKTTPGLTGSYVNLNLRSVTDQLDWRMSQTVAGTRHDATLNFTGNSWGARSSVGMTGGGDANWEFYSVQWDGFVDVSPASGARLRLLNTDGARLWIDLNNDSGFDASGDEFLDNGWGTGQRRHESDMSVHLAQGLHRIRVQFESATGSNNLQLLWDAVPTTVPASALFVDSGKTESGVTGSYVNLSLRDLADPIDWRTSALLQVAGTRVDAAVDFSSYSWGNPYSSGLTNGTTRDWDYFSVQWDGYVVIPANGVRLFLRSDDGSRMWIDANHDGVFSNDASELIDNDWGSDHPVRQSAPGQPLTAGTYQIRIQYEEGFAASVMQLQWDYHPQPAAAASVTAVTSATEHRPVIRWTPAEDAVGYDVWVNNLTTGQGAFVRQTSVSNWLVPSTDLPIGRYAVWVRSALVDGTYSAWSSQFNFSIDTAPEITPMSLMQDSPHPMVSWNAIAGAATYEIWLSNLTTMQSPYLTNASITATSWSPGAELPMGRYRIWVRARDAMDRPAQWSRSVDIIVAPAPDPVTPLVPTFDLTPTFEWTPVTGAVSYRLLLKNASTGAVIHDVTGLTGTSWTAPAN